MHFTVSIHVSQWLVCRAVYFGCKPSYREVINFLYTVARIEGPTINDNLRSHGNIGDCEQSIYCILINRPLTDADWGPLYMSPVNWAGLVYEISPCHSFKSVDGFIWEAGPGPVSRKPRKLFGPVKPFFVLINVTSVAKAMKVLRKLGCCLQIEVEIV